MGSCFRPGGHSCDREALVHMGEGVLLCDLYSPAPGGLCRADGRMCVKPGDQAEGWAVVGTAWIYSRLHPTHCLSL